MAEMRAGIGDSPPRPGDGRARRDLPVVPAADGAGETILDVPPLVEFDDAQDEPGPADLPPRSPAGQRPVRRRFLPPLSEAAAASRAALPPAEPSPAIGAGVRARRLLLASESSGPPPRPRPLRNLLVGAVVAAAVVLALAAAIVARSDWFAPVRAALTRSASSSTDEPPAD